MKLLAAIVLAAASVTAHKSELLSKEEGEKLGVIYMGNATQHSSHDDLPIPEHGYPDAFSWCDQDGVNYCTPSLNQHLPQYCGRFVKMHR